MERAGEVHLYPHTAEALDGIVCHVGQLNLNMPDMSWLYQVAKCLPDTEKYFPCGKWATIQCIEAQIERAAKQAVEET